MKNVLIGLVVVLMVGCGVVDESSKVDDAKITAALRNRATAFGNLLTKISKMDEATAKRKLSGFIEPSPSRNVKIDTYYREFSASSKKAKIIGQSVMSVTLASDKVNADVEYRMTAFTGRSTITAQQVTQWKLVDGKWYRTIVDPEVRGVR